LIGFPQKEDSNSARYHAAAVNCLCKNVGGAVSRLDHTWSQQRMLRTAPKSDPTQFIRDTYSDQNDDISDLRIIRKTANHFSSLAHTQLNIANTFRKPLELRTHQIRKHTHTHTYYTHHTRPTHTCKKHTKTHRRTTHASANTHVCVTRMYVGCVSVTSCVCSTHAYANVHTRGHRHIQHAYTKLTHAHTHTHTHTHDHRHTSNRA
jgi:hypothetical protein